LRRSVFLAATGGALLLPQVSRADVESVEDIAQGFPGVLGVYARTLGDGPPFLDYNSATSFPTASTIKVLIMATAFRAEENTPGLLDEIIVTRRKDLISGSDFMRVQPDGARFTVRQLLRPMITVSDNTISNYLITQFGFDAINQTGIAAGMTQTTIARHFLDYKAIVTHHDNVTSPADMGALLYVIAHGAREEVDTIVSATHAKEMLKIMLGQTDRDGIPAGLPRGTQVANKTGEIEGSRNDIAVVEPFTSSPFVLCIYTKWLTAYQPVYPAMHRLARLSYHLVAQTYG
jgi:beta-lactamase class A